MFFGVIYSIPGGISPLLWLHRHGHSEMSLFSFKIKHNTLVSVSTSTLPLGVGFLFMYAAKFVCWQNSAWRIIGLPRWIFGVNFSYSINSSLLFPHSQLTLTEKEESLILLIAFKDRGRMWRQSCSPSSSIWVWVTLPLLNNSGEAGNNLHAGLCSQVEVEVNIRRICWLFCRFWRLTCTAAVQQVVWKNNNLFFFFFLKKPKAWRGWEVALKMFWRREVSLIYSSGKARH